MNATEKMIKIINDKFTDSFGHKYDLIYMTDKNDGKGSVRRFKKKYNGSDPHVLNAIKQLGKEYVFELDAFWVEPHYRGRGYGKRILQKAVENLQGEIIILQCFLDMVEYYEKSGFKVVSKGNTMATMMYG